MKELMSAFTKRFGTDIGIVLYFDMSGHVFRETGIGDGENYNNSLFDFDDITKLTVSDIERG